MYKNFKSLADKLFAICFIMALLPFFLIIVILLKFSGEGEVFYLQERIGFKNMKFNIIKFATMLKNSANIGTGLITLRNDPRVTFIGKFLRMSKINELPQILNILLGDMSLVGPRPLVDKTFEPYSEEVKSKIYNVKPGITGIGSIVFRDEEKLLSECTIDPKDFYNSVIAPYKGALEMWYLENISFKTDFLILFLTAWYIVFPNSMLTSKIFPTLPKKTF
jgi:lipopolysaccharide/colanic/teichoic acid biosynthesis glycosyltransferase